MSRLSLTLVLLSAIVALAKGSASNADWNALSAQVGGRLIAGVPVASPCFDNLNGVSKPVNSTACVAVQTSYADPFARSNTSSGFINSQWETCQATGAQCVLDSTDPSNPTAVSAPFTCQQGSISQYYLDVRTAADVAAAFTFSTKTGVPLVIKNTGHDFIGRSSAPNSLALWTHNLKTITYNPQFVPQGCSNSSPGVTTGAGVQWLEAYEFAEANKFTFVGGSAPSVGTSGGWLQGGGHSPLSNTMGLGADRVLEFKIVTPDGELRVVNACQNQDLFFALRGGGGGTFGVVLESTSLTSPVVTLQSVVVQLPFPNDTLVESLYSIAIDNGLKWAGEGWGGWIAIGKAILVTPKLSPAEAAASMAPLTQFVDQLVSEGVQASVNVTQQPSFLSWYQSLSQVVANFDQTGVELPLASRLVNKDNFQTAASRAQLLAALAATNKATGSVLFNISPPFSFAGDNGTSFTPLWRDSIYHITVDQPFNFNATTAQKAASYKFVSEVIDNLRKITPAAAYVNEADVYEPNHAVTFWGDNYARLLQIKQKYDPNHLLDCWHCVGSQPASPRFSCYLDVTEN